MTMPRTHKFHYAEGVKSKVFFSSRGRHPIFDCDWSSDVCSSDLSCASCTWGRPTPSVTSPRGCTYPAPTSDGGFATSAPTWPPSTSGLDLWCCSPTTDRRERRSEERRVGEECRPRGSPDH